MPAAKYTEAQRAEALALYETDGPSAVTARFGIPKGTVTGWAKANGTRTVRNERAREATEAVQVDSKLRRQRIINRLYGRAEKVLDRLEAGQYVYRMAGPMGSEKVSDDDPPAGDERNLATSIAVYLDKATKLEDYDRTGDESGAAVDKWLAYMMGGPGGGETPSG